MENMNGTKLPHALRIPILLLRLILGLNLFYIGWSALFNQPLAKELRARSMGDLYAWIGSATGGLPWLHVIAPWALMIIGACILLGFLTRIASGLGIFLLLFTSFPGLASLSINVYQFVNDAALAAVCLLILFTTNAGKYVGIDAFFHVKFTPKNKE